MPSRFDVDDGLWAELEPSLLPVAQRRYRYPGRKRLDDRAALNGILFVLHTGIAWARPAGRVRLRLGGYLLAATARVAAGRGLGAAAPGGPPEAQRRRRDRLVQGRRRLQPHQGAFGGLHTGPSPVDRARAGSKHHLLTDAGGLPLAITLTGGNRNDVTQLLPLVDGVAPIAGKVGRPRRRPDRLLADRGYDHDKYRREAWVRGIKPLIARRGEDNGSGLAPNAGWWSAASPGSTSSAGFASAGSVTPTNTSPSCTLPARLSAGGRLESDYETGSRSGGRGRCRRRQPATGRLSRAG